MTTSSNARKSALLNVVTNSKAIEAGEIQSTSLNFGINTFNDKVMREKLPKDVYVKLRDTIKAGVKLDMEIANSVAHAMKEWAMSKGVTHFTHWFQPQTGLTAEKHDSFLEIDSDGVALDRFRGNQLVQGEPDASSFPSGGRRTTFEARGYTMWDPSSPAFIIDGPKGGILCIPSVFISYHGEALDKKTPLLRAMETLNKSALKVVKFFGNDKVTRVIPTIGTEQEYFLIDKSFYALRPDLQVSGRTLMGAKPPKGQQLDDHYFGAIKERALAFMQEVEAELYKLGVPAKTRHNEVAPHQFELAPIYAEANVGSDRNQMMMEVLKKVGNRHGLAVLLHEKPFAGINGSGKHNNWSLEDSEGNNLLDPGDTPEQNLQFLVFLTSVLRAVHKYGDLLRSTVASAYNDHRLGANEAPPAIMSVFLGDRLSTILDDLKDGRQSKPAEEFVIDLGVNNLPKILRDNTDRNRTSPFAFTGQKFEFRALGSSASVSLANTVLSAAVSESVDLIMADIEKTVKSGSSKEDAVLQVLSSYVKESEPIRFEGNNYSDEWAAEAEKRGLPNVKRTGYALDALVTDKNLDLFVSQNIFTKDEVVSRYNTKLEQYIIALNIEVEMFNELVYTRVIPAATKYQEKLLNVIQATEAVKSTTGVEVAKSQVDLLKKVTEAVQEVSEKCAALKIKLQEVEGLEEDLSKAAKVVSDELVDMLEEARKPVDQLEGLIDDTLWPLPKYTEMLFIM